MLSRKERVEFFVAFVAFVAFVFFVVSGYPVAAITPSPRPIPTLIKDFS
jgi:hypothetical protein